MSLRNRYHRHHLTRSKVCKRGEILDLERIQILTKLDGRKISFPLMEICAGFGCLQDSMVSRLVSWFRFCVVIYGYLMALCLLLLPAKPVDPMKLDRPTNATRSPDEASRIYKRLDLTFCWSCCIIRVAFAFINLLLHSLLFSRSSYRSGTSKDDGRARQIAQVTTLRSSLLRLARLRDKLELALEESISSTVGQLKSLRSISRSPLKPHQCH